MFHFSAIQLFYTVRNMFELYCNVVPTYHKQRLVSNNFVFNIKLIIILTDFVLQNNIYLSLNVDSGSK